MGSNPTQATMENMFKVGDTTMLKSGGPEMTVESVDKEGIVHCVWFTSEPPEYLGRGEFFPEMLDSPNRDND